MTEPISVVVADDHPVFRGGLGALLTSAGDIEVVGEAGNGDEAVALVADLVPDVVVMDINMPGGINGVEATRRITTSSPSVRVLILTMFDDEESVFAALRAGAAGYLLKDSEHEDVVRSVKAVARNEVIFGAGVAQRVQAFFSGARPEPHSPFPQLTRREIEILDLVAAGENNAVIARKLGIAPKTVRNSTSNIFLKMHAADRAQAIIRAREAGLGRGTWPG